MKRVAPEVGFEPTGVISSQMLSRQRAYDHLRTLANIIIGYRLLTIYDLNTPQLLWSLAIPIILNQDLFEYDAKKISNINQLYYLQGKNHLV